MTNDSALTSFSIYNFRWTEPTMFLGNPVCHWGIFRAYCQPDRVLLDVCWLRGEREIRQGLERGRGAQPPLHSTGVGLGPFDP